MAGLAREVDGAVRALAQVHRGDPAARDGRLFAVRVGLHVGVGVTGAVDVADRAVPGHTNAVRGVLRGGELGRLALAVDVDEPVSGGCDHTVLGGYGRGDL